MSSVEHKPRKRISSCPSTRLANPASNLWHGWIKLMHAITLMVVYSWRLWSHAMDTKLYQHISTGYDYLSLGQCKISYVSNGGSSTSNFTQPCIIIEHMVTITDSRLILRCYSRLKPSSYVSRMVIMTSTCITQSTPRCCKAVSRCFEMTARQPLATPLRRYVTLTHLPRVPHVCVHESCPQWFR